jgi:hypothetical protein
MHLALKVLYLQALLSIFPGWQSQAVALGGNKRIIAAHDNVR